MCVTGPSAARKKPNVKLSYVEVAINMSLNVYHLEQWILDFDKKLGVP